MGEMKIIRSIHGKTLPKRTQGRPPKRWKECWTSTSEEA